MMVQKTVENAAKLLHSNRQIQSLQLVIPWLVVTLAELLNMIIANRSIVKLILQSSCAVRDVTEAELSRFVKEYPMMETLQLHDHRFTADAAIEFMNQLDSLKCFLFCIKDRAELNRLLSQLDGKWQHQTLWSLNDFDIKIKIFLKI